MLSKRVVLVVVALFCLVALVPAALYSQNISSGTIAGTVTDPSNAAVADATVTLTDTATNIPRTTATNEVGRYVFANVPPGTYTLTINKAGFRASKITGQVVNKPESRLEVEHLVPKWFLHDPGDVVAERAELHVVAEPQIHRQSVVLAPVVLREERGGNGENQQSQKEQFSHEKPPVTRRTLAELEPGI